MSIGSKYSLRLGFRLLVKYIYCSFYIIDSSFLSFQDPATSRTLTLISKTIQTLGSLAKSKSVSLSAKCVFFILITAVTKLDLYFSLTVKSTLNFLTSLSFKANFKESYMAAFYDYFNEQKYADAVKNVSVNFLSLLHSVNLKIALFC